MNKINFSRANILKISSAFFLFTAWEIAGRVPISFAFPTFLETMEALISIILNGSIFIAYSDTLRPLFLGIAISAFFGIILGLSIGLSEKTDWLISPIFIIMQAAPLAALIPLLIMVYGVQLTSKVLVVVIMSMPVIVLNTAGAVKNTSSSLQEMCFSYLGSKKDNILKVILPSAAPIIFAGLRLGVSAGFIGAILAELKITPTGIGDIISFSRSRADYPTMYAAIFSIIVLAVIFINILEKIEKKTFKGNQKEYISN